MYFISSFTLCLIPSFLSSQMSLISQFYEGSSCFRRVSKLTPLTQVWTHLLPGRSTYRDKRRKRGRKKRRKMTRWVGWMCATGQGSQKNMCRVVATELGAHMQKSRHNHLALDFQKSQVNFFLVVLILGKAASNPALKEAPCHPWSKRQERAVELVKCNPVKWNYKVPPCLIRYLCKLLFQGLCTLKSHLK